MALEAAQAFTFDVSNNSLSGDLPSFLAPARLPRYLNASSIALAVSQPEIAFKKPETFHHGNASRAVIPYDAIITAPLGISSAIFLMSKLSLRLPAPQESTA